jgi:hypothetical protein
MAEVLPLLKRLPTTISVLLTPLISCPDGLIRGDQIQKAFSNVTFSPLLRLPPARFVTEVPDSDEPDLFGAIREMIERLYSRVSDKALPDDGVIPYGPFGFARTGGLVVLFSNCPDNTIPTIHHVSKSWEPLFPRVTRE